MDWLIGYYSERVQRTIDQWPIGVRAVYARITERMVVGKEIVVLHAFIKKSDKTPLKELAIARRRLKEIGDENT